MRIKTVGVALSCLTILLVGARLTLNELRWGHFNDLVFNQKDWKDKTPWTGDPFTPQAPLRGRMVIDLVHNRLRIGMAKSDIHSLLGPPDSNKPEKWDYLVGNYSGFRIDGDYLSIIFDNDWRVAGFYCWQS